MRSLKIGNFARLATLALKEHLPAISEASFALIDFGPDTIGMLRRAAYYVDRLLKGEKVADLPVEPTKYELNINLRTAKSLGISAPRTMLARADNVMA